MSKGKRSSDIDAAIVALAEGIATVDQIAASTGWGVVEGCLVPEPDTWYADDGNAEVTYDYVSSGHDAAEEYVSDGDWGPQDETIWIRVSTWRMGIYSDGEWVRVDEDAYSIAVELDEPDCRGGHDHDWESPYSVLGGLKENPGVWGNGGGVIIREVCAHCGTYRVTNTWAQDRATGEQGLRSVSYDAADAASVEWIDRRAVAAAVEALEAAGYDVQEMATGRRYIADLAPDSSLPEYDDDTSPGSAWDDECDRLLAGIESIVAPHGCEASWDDDDVVIEAVGT